MKGKRFHKLKKKIKTYKTKYVVTLFVITLVILGGIIIARSRYVLKSDVIGMASANAFYFNSYSLGESEKQINTNNIEFKLYNYEDALRVSDENINYEVKAEVITPENSSITTKILVNDQENNGGTLVGGKVSTDTIKVELDNYNTNMGEISVRVYAIATAPYTKTMSAVFNINDDENSQNYDLNLKNEDECENLLIRTYDYSGKLEINFNSDKVKVYDERKENVTISDNTVIIDVDNNSNYSIKFIKLTSEEIKLNEDISVKEQ